MVLLPLLQCFLLPIICAALLQVVAKLEKGVGEVGGDGLVVVQTDTDTNSSGPGTSLKQDHFVAPLPAHAQVTKEQEAEKAMNEEKEKEQRWPPTPSSDSNPKQQQRPRLTLPLRLPSIGTRRAPATSRIFPGAMIPVQAPSSSSSTSSANPRVQLHLRPPLESKFCSGVDSARRTRFTPAHRLANPNPNSHPNPNPSPRARRRRRPTHAQRVHQWFTTAVPRVGALYADVCVWGGEERADVY